MKRLYIKRNNGLVFWRIGRLGGSFYLARRRVQSQTWLTRRSKAGYPMIVRVRTPIDLLRARAPQ